MTRFELTLRHRLRTYQQTADMMSDEDIRVVVGVDFGTTFSGFAYAHVKDPENIETHEKWPTDRGFEVQPRANTILHYEKANLERVFRWGVGTLVRPRKRHWDPWVHVVENFKLHFAGASPKSKLPPGIEADKAIVDYLKQMNMLIKDTLKPAWQELKYPDQVRFVFTVPAEYTPQQRLRMRKFVYEAGFVKTHLATNLKLTTEPEAAALYCFEKCKQYLLDVRDCYLIVDCGGGTVDLTTRQILGDDKVGEITEQTGDFCGGTYVDEEFVAYLQNRIFSLDLKNFKKHDYRDYQRLVFAFGKEFKNRFKGTEDLSDYDDFDLRRHAESITKYVGDRDKAILDENDWLIEISYRDLKNMFDKVVNRIRNLVKDQIASVKRPKNVKAMFLVGGFSESPYLQKCMMDVFGSNMKVICPPRPQLATVRGAVKYGLNMKLVNSRVLKYTYGIKCIRKWTPDDLPSRKEADGTIHVFSRLATKGEQVPVEKQFSNTFMPIHGDQTVAVFKVLTSKQIEPEYPDEPPMVSLGTLKIDIPDVQLGRKRRIEFSLTFGKNEIEATAVRKGTEYLSPHKMNDRRLKQYTTTLELDM